jgi:hypothetical protein
MPDRRLPAILQPVVLHLVRASGATIDVSTRVIDLEVEGGQTYVVVTCPSDRDLHEQYEAAALSWTHPLGRLTVPAATQPGLRDYGRVWRVLPIGEVSRHQDRRYFRAELAVPVRVRWGGSEETDPEQRQGVTIDISEGGTLALLRGEPPEIGAEVEVTLRVNGTELSNPASVVREVRLPGGTGVALSFEEPPKNGPELRRAVVAAERRSLRAAR